MVLVLASALFWVREVIVGVGVGCGFDVGLICLVRFVFGVVCFVSFCCVLCCIVLCGRCFGLLRCLCV